MISVNKLHHRHDNTGRMLSVVWYVAQCHVVCLTDIRERAPCYQYI